MSTAASDGIVRWQTTAYARCWWGDSAPEYRAYHDTEWGFPVADDVRLFEKLSLEGFQAGLSWLTILRKREAFRRAFAGFDFEQVARFGERDVARLLDDASIVRHRGKIEAVINNARRAVELVEAEGSLAALRVALRAAGRAPALLDRAGLAELAQTDGVAGARARPQAARLAVRRPDDRLRVHAGDGPRQRPPRRLRRRRARRARARRVHPPAWPPPARAGAPARAGMPARAWA